MTATDTRPADLAALRTELRVEVERLHGAEWGPATLGMPIDEVLYARTGLALATARRRRSVVAFLPDVPDPTTDIGAAMALVDQLQADGWPEGTGDAFRDVMYDLFDAMTWTVPGWDAKNAHDWWLRFCPANIRPLVLALAVLAARGAEWRRYLPLLTEET